MTSPSRVLRLDVLRGLAIFAMLMAHANSLLVGAPRVWGFGVGHLNDLASPLFALVMGMAAQLVFARDEPWGSWRFLRHQWLRAAIFIGLGVWAATWGSWVDIVLAYLGLMLIFGAPLALLRTRYLIGVGVLLTIAGPLINRWARSAVTIEWYSQHWLVQDLTKWAALGHNYRLTNLLPFFILGLLLQRAPLRDWVTNSWRNSSWLFLVALASYAVEPIMVRVLGWADPVSGSYPDMARDLALVLFAYLGAVVLENWANRPVVRTGLIDLLADLGQVALSIYLLHVWIISLAADWGWRGEPSPHLAGWLLLVPGMVLVGVCWRRLAGPGPVEWLMGVVLRGRVSYNRR